MLAKLHSRLGDFWWYSLMLFCACRAADLLNAFIGLWLVPKYVDPSELGAVMPLTQFANFLAIPIAAFANTFRNELTRLSINKEFGKLKTLMRGVFAATAVFLFVAIIAARVLLPAFLERIRIVEGSLGLVIIAASFVSAVAPIYSNALQALKKFKAQSILSIVGAPVRLIAMLLAMPFRAITGYFIGQAATPAFSIAASVLALRKELSVKAEPYWTRETLKKFSGLFALFLLMASSGGFLGLIESTIIRQRLPYLDSAGYYMATRFSEIASFFLATVAFTIFPFTAKLAAAKQDTKPLVFKAAAASIAFSTIVALPFFFVGKPILAMLPQGEQYAEYWWAIPWLIGISMFSAFAGIFTTAEISANRFSYLKWYIPLDIAYPIILLLITGHGYYAHLLPTSCAAFLDAHNIRSLSTMLLWMTTFNALKATLCLLSLTNRRIESHTRENK